MAKRYDIKRYAAWNFDDYFCLKPPAVLVAVIIYLCRSFVMLTIYMLASVKGATGDMGVLLQGGDHPSSLAITALPALLVLIALIRRSPNGGRIPRSIWKRGRALLATSALLEIGTAVFFLSTLTAGETPSLAVAFLFLDVYILLYLLLSTRVKDTFSDFPPTLAALRSQPVTER
jgi:hypothetical protein